MHQLATILQWLRNLIFGSGINDKILYEFTKQNPEIKQEMTMQQIDQLIKTIDQKNNKIEQKAQEKKKKLKYFYERNNEKQARDLAVEIKKLTKQIEKASQNKKYLKAIAQQLKSKSITKVQVWEQKNKQISMDFNNFIKNQKNRVPKQKNQAQVEKYKFHTYNERKVLTKKSVLKQGYDQIALMLQNLN